MKYNELVSVVMPVHNGEKFLKEAIESILQQTYTNFELLIIENCSTDKSLEIIKLYKDSRIRIITEKQCGIAQAYNRGFKEAKGEYVLIHDQDDISLDTRLQSQLFFIIENDLDICGSSFMIIDKDSRIVNEIQPPTQNDEIKERLLFDFFSLFNPTLIIKKEVIEKLNYFDEDIPIGSDFDFLLRGIRKYKCGNNIKTLLKYRYHLSSTSKKNSKVGKNIDFRISLKHFRILSEELSDPNFTLSKIYFYYNKFLKSFGCLVKSSVKKGLSNAKIKHLFLTTVFAFPIWVLRRFNLFFNKNVNEILSLIRK